MFSVPLAETSNKLMWFASNLKLLFMSAKTEPPESNKSLEYVVSFI